MEGDFRRLVLCKVLSVCVRVCVCACACACVQVFACNSLKEPDMCSKLSVSLMRTLRDGRHNCSLSC